MTTPVSMDAATLVLVVNITILISLFVVHDEYHQTPLLSLILALSLGLAGTGGRLQTSQASITCLITLVNMS